MNYLRNASLFLFMGLILHGISVLLDSDFFSVFLQDNLITLLIALLAINVTTMSVIMTKLREITEKNRVDFSKSIKSMKVSILEQVWLIVIASAVLIAKGSSIISNLWVYSEFVLNVMLIAVFLYAVYILYDTANGIFVILKHEND